MNEHQFRHQMSFAMRDGYSRRLVRYRDKSFMKTINMDEEHYTLNDDDSFNMYGGQVFFEHTPDLRIEFSIDNYSEKRDDMIT